MNKNSWRTMSSDGSYVMSDKDMIADCYGNVSNAERIVLAVNNHDKLIEAVELALNHMREFLELQTFKKKSCKEISRVERILNLAKGTVQ